MGSNPTLSASSIASLPARAVALALVLVGTLAPMIGWLERRRINVLRERDERAERSYTAQTAGGASGERAADVALDIADEIRAESRDEEQAADTPITGGEPH